MIFSDRDATQRRGQGKWLTWLTLAAGAVMCVMAMLLS